MICVFHWGGHLGIEGNSLYAIEDRAMFLKNIISLKGIVFGPKKRYRTRGKLFLFFSGFLSHRNKKLNTSVSAW